MDVKHEQRFGGHHAMVPIRSGFHSMHQSINLSMGSECVTADFPKEETLSDTDALYLRQAIRHSHTARERGNRPFGALIVSKSGETLVEFYNQTKEALALCDVFRGNLFVGHSTGGLCTRCGADAANAWAQRRVPRSRVVHQRDLPSLSSPH